MRLNLGLVAVGATTFALSTMGLAAASGASPTPTVRQALASVNGRSETILVDQSGQPLYTYKPDTLRHSLVSGSLAALWPPLTGSAATDAGLPGKLAVVQTQNGRQVTYNGHFLYTFVQDSAGVLQGQTPAIVEGQGVQNFFVATPTLSVLAGTSAHVSPSGSANGSW
jgi:predicted lipoprotein with Yx(FWY)xxD motif